ncbi:10118_t:CDS:2 [Diversispora eburnea]|uniref:10118_t:CDS:1 n=1 Tax=Diversispora eburnea TaxID=1213867 RepID=A0A9N8YUA1_9GLOM|nr:10118_t:CDS:2 [Diversispora eburnea]
MILTSEEKSPNLWAKVIYAAKDDELSLNEGELIRDIIEVIGRWRKGTSKDRTRTGLFPVIGNEVRSRSDERSSDVGIYEKQILRK